MAALKWDEQAQAYTETQNVPMRYDVESGAWVETTGMAWDEESQAWTERWNTGVSAYVYGAASETVTIKKDGIIVATVETGSNGQSTEHITLSSGTYTLTGSVSGWTEEQTVDKDTTKFRAMPEGAFYWYGNECGQDYYPAAYKSGTNYVSSAYPVIAPSLTKNLNSMVIVNPAGSSNVGTVFGSKAIDWSKYETLNADFKCVFHTNYAQFYLYTTDDVKNNYQSDSYADSMLHLVPDKTVYRNVKTATHYDYLALSFYMNMTMTLNALWAE